MLTIKLQDWKYNKINVQKIANIMVAKLKDYNVVSRMTFADNTITFSKDGENKYFSSSRENRIIMSPGDKRIKTLGRDYLITKRLTEEQYKIMIDSILGTLDNLKISADVSLEGKVWRTGLVNRMDNIFKPVKFAVKG